MYWRIAASCPDGRAMRVIRSKCAHKPAGWRPSKASDDFKGRGSFRTDVVAERPGGRLHQSRPSGRRPPTGLPSSGGVGRLEGLGSAREASLRHVVGDRAGRPEKCPLPGCNRRPPERARKRGRPFNSKPLAAFHVGHEHRPILRIRDRLPGPGSQVEVLPGLLCVAGHGVSPGQGLVRIGEIEVAHVSPIGLGRLHAARRVFQRRGARPEPGAQWLAASATPAITLRQLGNQDKLGFFAPSWGAAASAPSTVRSKHVRM